MSNLKTSLVVAGAEILAPVLAIGAVLTIGDHLEPVKQFVAEHIVKPNLDFIKHNFKNALKSESKTLKTVESLFETPLHLPDKVPFELASPDEQAKRIAGVITKGMTELSLELPISYTIQKVLNNDNKNIGKIIFADATVQICSMFALSTFLAKPAQCLRENLQHIGEKHFGLKKKIAEDVGLLIVNNGIPSITALVAALCVAHTGSGHSR